MKKKGEEYNSIVYSSEHGRMCSGCGKPAALCDCAKTQGQPQKDGIVRVSRLTRGRKGKGVMIIAGVPLDSGGLNKLGKKLKVKFGVGGSVKNGIIELQGDFREKLVEELRQHGWIVKLSGG